MSVWVIVVGAGRGQRFGSLKQYEALGSGTVLSCAVEVAARNSDGVVVVVPADHLAVDKLELAPHPVVAGQESRSGSVRAGLDAVPPEVDVILVHDAARPLASDALYRSVIAAVEGGADAALPVVPVHDTIRHVDGGNVDRTGLQVVQTPQGFRAEVLRRVHADEPEATDDASLVEAAGGRVETVTGSTRNRKITEPDDLAIARELRADP